MEIKWQSRYEHLLELTKRDYTLFREATTNVQAAQAECLSRIVSACCDTPFGTRHHFRDIRSPLDFQRHVPSSDYRAYAKRFERGESDYFVNSPTKVWAWSSGTEHARKRLPLSAHLVEEFEAAIAPWLHSLLLSHPELSAGPAYWIVGPQIPASHTLGENATDDSAYFSPALLSALAPILVHTHPCGVRGGFQEWAFFTLLHLILEPDLTWVSVWSPTLLTELLESFVALRPFLEESLRFGKCDHITLPLAPETVSTLNGMLSSRREASLHQLAIITRSDSPQWEEIWPRLTLCSCWGDGWAALFLQRLMRQLPNVRIQRKGLLATEGVVSLPLECAGQGDPVLAVTSHLFEFVHPSSHIPLLAHELTVGERYEVLITTGGGLYRYALGDQVEVTGWFNQAPRLRFLGKSSGVSDLCGEKLHEGFVAACLEKLSEALSLDLSGTTLRPVVSELGQYYEACLPALNESQREQVRVGLEGQLMSNPHYAQCRALHQLRSLRISDGELARPINATLSTTKERVLYSTPIDVRSSDSSQMRSEVRDTSRA